MLGYIFAGQVKVFSYRSDTLGSRRCASCWISDFFLPLWLLAGGTYDVVVLVSLASLDSALPMSAAPFSGLWFLGYIGSFCGVLVSMVKCVLL